MKKKLFTKKNFIRIGIIACSLLIAFLLSLVRQKWIGKQVDQMMAERWNPEGGVAQISCFFSRQAGVSEFQLTGFEHMLDNALKEASITLESPNQGARLWSDAYSANGSIMITTERTSLFVKAMGIGGDFFQFHPQKLLYGNYFSGSDLNKDYVVIDEETAWQLYGGIDVSGKFVTIGGRPHMIAGVIERPQGKMEKAAGLEESIVYVSMETLENYGQSEGISTYEIVMPNPIKDFAMQKVKENLGVDEREVVYVENTGRFDVAKSLDIILQYGYRSMNVRGVIFPYWENLARGCEDRLALVTLFYVTFLVIPSGIAILWVIQAWRHKGWTFGTVVRKGSDLIYSLQSNRMVKKQNKNISKRKPIKVFDEEEEENEKKK